MSKVCGIDLGTTYSAISWYDNANSRVETIDLVDYADGLKLLPSVVYYPGEEQSIVVGETAKNAGKQQPERVITGIKRAMGTDYKTPEIDGQTYSPQQVQAEILKALAHDAQIYCGEEIIDVVITVPAWFGDIERAATKEAGELAGLNVIGLLPEPHAVALAYSVEQAIEIDNKHILVYDLGGGTFDVVLIHVTAEEVDNKIKLKMETLCKDGSRELGGLDWDRTLAEIVAYKVTQQFNTDVWQNPLNETILLENCERAKRELSRIDSTMIVADLENHQVEITRAELEDSTRDLLQRTEMLIEEVLEQAEQKHNIHRDQIDIMLAGGSSKMPMIKKTIEELTGQPVLRYRNPELLVTIGAAYWAHVQTSEEDITINRNTKDGVESKQVGITDVIDKSLYSVGVEVLRPDQQGNPKKYNSIIVPKDAPTGKTYNKDFYTSEDGMTRIDVRFYRGESEDIEECELLMMITILNLPPNLPKGTKVEVSLKYDESGIFQGQAVVETGQKVDIIIERNRENL